MHLSSLDCKSETLENEECSSLREVIAETLTASLVK